MRRFVLSRLLQAIPVLIGVSVVGFAVLRLAPGDPVLMMLPGDATREEMDAMREALGLNRSLPAQYLGWLGQVLAGNFGQSLYTSRPVLTEILERLPNTALLASASILLAMALGMPLGILAAVFRGRAPDTISMVVSVVGWSMPNFWIGLVLITVFSVWLGWLPTGGMYDIMEMERTTADLLRHLILPSVTLGLSYMAYMARFTRSCLLEVLAQDYIRTARAKGAGGARVVFIHAMRNSLIPIISVLGVSIGHLLGGAVIVEAVFGWPGLGTLMLQGILARDFVLVQGAMLFAAFVFMAVNLGADFLYSLVDPRIRHE